MAIINPKQNEAEQEAQHAELARAQDYARRYDTLGSSSAGEERSAMVNTQQQTPWSQPPPAYEGSYRNSAAVPFPSPSRRSDDVIDADERSALLPTVDRRRRGSDPVAKEQSVHRRTRGCAGYIVVVILLVILIGFLKGDQHSSRDGRGSIPSPDPPEKDGKAVKSPSWSEPIRLPPTDWPRHSVPLYSSTAWFSLPADDELTYVHATGAVGGSVTLLPAERLPADEWEQHNDGKTKDRVLVKVESRFTDVELRDESFVGLVSKSKKEHGVSIYREHTDEPVYLPSLIEFRVLVYLPQPAQRTSKGLAQDGSSFLEHFELELSNMRLSVDLDDFEPSRGITFGRFDDQQGNGGGSLKGDLHALDSVVLSLANGALRSAATPPYEVRAPVIEIKTQNGGISLARLLASKKILIQSGNGAIEVKDSAVAPTIDVEARTGRLQGLFKPSESLTALARTGSVHVKVDLGDEDASARQVKDKFATCKVHVSSQSGSTSVEYVHHPSSVRLESDISSHTGAVHVKHHTGFEGAFSLTTAVGALNVQGPDPSSSAPKVFTLDRDERKGWMKKYVEGKTYLRSHKWPASGARDDAAFALSHSTAKTQTGSLHAEF